MVSCYNSFKSYILTRKCIYRLPTFLTINSISLNNINWLFFVTQTQNQFKNNEFVLFS